MIEKEMKVMENMMNDKEDKYKKMLELYKKYRAGTIKDEELNLKQKILLSRLYDIEIQKLEDENDKNLNKIINYMKKNKLLN
jgi:Ca2+-binding EF-hand superfamily protein